jgi:polyisoprenoid-binding protein YceI
MKTTLFALWLASTTISAPAAWRAAQSDIRVTCPMTIGGSFDARTTALSGTLTVSTSRSAAFDGTLAVDLRTLETGIALRNAHLRETYLEVDKPGYDEAILSEIDLKGLTPDAPQGKGSFTGSMTLHGVKKPVAGPVVLRQAGGGLEVRASFPITLSDYNIAEPRYLGVGVKSVVQVQVIFSVTH